MSDISLTFPVWMTPVLIGVLYWPVLLAAAAILAALGTVARRRLRAVFFGIAALVLLPCLAVPVFYVASSIESARGAASYARTHETLTAPRQIDGLTVPPGTAVTWTDERHESASSLDLPGPTPLLGATVVGQLENIAGRWWSGTLAADATIGDWPCRAGQVWLSREGAPLQCILAADHADHGVIIPAGTEVGMAPATGRLQELRLPDDRTMPLPSIGANLPSGSSLFFRPDGAIERAYVPEPGIFQIGEVPLRFEIRWVYEDAVPGSAFQLRGEVAADTTVDGALAPAGTPITVDIATHTARIAPRL